MKTRPIAPILFMTVFGTGAYTQQSLSDTIELDEVVVTGSKIEVARKNVPLTVSVISAEEIEQSGESALLPVISQQVPGLFVTERGITGFGVSGGAAGQINIRGLGGNPTTQVLILIDGHPQFMGMMGHHLPDAYVSSDAERVEVIRGPASILYGSNAFGGVINIITKKQQQDGITLNAKALYGSYNTQKISLSSGLLKNNFSVFASINHDQTHGHRDTSDFKITNGYLKTGYKFNNHLSAVADISLSAFESSDPGIDTASRAGYKIDIMRGKAALSIDNKYNLFEGALKFYYNFGRHDISDGWHSNDAMYGMMFYQAIKLFESISLTAGYDFMEYGGKGSPITTVLRDENGNIIPGPTGRPQFQTSELDNKWVTMQNHALYLNYQHNLFTSLSLNAGIRYEMNSAYNDEIIPQAGIAWNVSTITTFKSTVSKGYRPPSIRELYLFPPANDLLEPERMMNYEVSWIQKWHNQKLRTELTAYLCKGDNRIIMVPPIAPPPPIYRNTGDFKNMGMEFAGMFNLSPNFKIHANYSFIHMDTKLAGTPEHNLFASANYKLKKFNFNFSLQHIANLYNIVGSETVVFEKNYSVAGAKIAFKASPLINIFIHADNLLNQKYYINYGYPMPGVNFSAGISMNFKKELTRPDSRL